MDTISVAKVMVVDSLSTIAPKADVISHNVNFDWGLFVSIITLIAGTIMFWKYDKRLKKQEQILNDYAIKDYQKAEDDSRRARIMANVIKGDKGKRTIKVYNNGAADAHNVNFEIMSDNVNDSNILVMNFEIFPYKKIAPSTGTEFYIHTTYGTPNVIDVKITWKDDFQEYNESTQTLTLC